MCDAGIKEQGAGGELVISTWLNTAKLNQDEAFSTSFQLPSGNRC